MGRTVGIDLGTTYSLIAYLEPQTGAPKCIPGPNGSTLCPSVVSVDTDGRILVGDPARERLLTNPDRTIYSVKRLMGRGVADIRDELTRFPFRIDEKSSNVIRVRLGDKLFTPPEISAYILRELNPGRKNISTIQSTVQSSPSQPISTTRSAKPLKTPAALPASKSCVSSTNQPQPRSPMASTNRSAATLPFTISVAARSIFPS